jgi:hypothetical protein
VRSVPCRICSCIVSLSFLASCASTGGPPGITTPQNVDVDHLFTIVLNKSGSGTDCVVQVAPDAGAEVKVKAGKKVGWNIVNLCNDERKYVLELKFMYGSENGPEKKILKDEEWSTDGTVFMAKVKKKSFTGAEKCGDYEEAPCGRYKYSVRVNTYFVDPEFEIVY